MQTDANVESEEVCDLQCPKHSRDTEFAWVKITKLGAVHYGIAFCDKDKNVF